MQAYRDSAHEGLDPGAMFNNSRGALQASAQMLLQLDVAEPPHGSHLDRFFAEVRQVEALGRRMRFNGRIEV